MDLSITDLEELATQCRLAAQALRDQGNETRAKRLLAALEPIQDELDAAAEEAAERWAEDFHGGSEPFTAKERHDAAWEEKRRLG